MQLMDYVWRHTALGYDFRARYRPTFHLLEHALAPLPYDQWPARFAELAQGFGTPARLDRIEAARGALGERTEKPIDLERGEIETFEREGGGIRLAKRLGASPYVAIVDYAGPDSRRARVLTYAINWAVEFAIVAVLVFFWVWPFWRDLRRMHLAAEEVGAGRFDPSTRVGRFSPLRAFAEAFRAMAGRIAALLQSHRTLTSAVSHELRTPLARLRFSHSLARQESSAEGKDRYLAR